MSEKEQHIIDDYLKAYWAGESSLEQEAALKAYFRGGKIAERHAPYQALFGYFQIAKDQPIGQLAPASSAAPRGRFRSPILLRMAATLAILLGLGLGIRYAFFPKVETSLMADTYQDPEVAYQEARKALMMVSARLNAGKKYQKEISRLHKATDIFYPSKR